jgi:hypothetical protein
MLVDLVLAISGVSNRGLVLKILMATDCFGARPSSRWRCTSWIFVSEIYHAATTREQHETDAFNLLIPYEKIEYSSGIVPNTWDDMLQQNTGPGVHLAVIFAMDERYGEISMSAQLPTRHDSGMINKPCVLSA